MASPACGVYPVRRMTDRRAIAALGAILAVALALRLGWGLTRPTDAASLALLPDQAEYVELAASLLRGDGLSLYDARFAQHDLARRMPGYPLLVAALGADARRVRLAQALLDTGTVLAVAVAAARLAGTRAALVAAALAAVNPVLIAFSGMVLSETATAAILAWGIALLAGPARHAVAGAALLALLPALRPSLLAAPLLLAACAAWARRGEPARRRWLLPAVAGAATLLVLAPWAARNERALGTRVWTTTHTGISLYDGLHDGATGASDQSFVATLPDSVRALDEVERDRWFRAAAAAWATAHPLEAATLALRKAARTWSPFPLSERFGAQPAYVLAGLTYGLPVLLLAAAGLTRGLPGAWRLALVLPAAWLTLVHAAGVGSLRYRAPVEPQIVLLAATFIAPPRAPRHDAAAA